jgi:hypothetical protein
MRVCAVLVNLNKLFFAIVFVVFFVLSTGRSLATILAFDWRNYQTVRSSIHVCLFRRGVVRANEKCLHHVNKVCGTPISFLSRTRPLTLIFANLAIFRPTAKPTKSIRVL